MTRPPVFFLKLQFYNKKTDEDRRYIGDLIRLQTLQLYNVQVKNPIKEVTKLWRFPWDEDKAKIITAQEREMSRDNMYNLINELL